MTTTVRVQARAWGARVETNGETIELGAHQDRSFQIEEGSQSFTVTQNEAPASESTDSTSDRSSAPASSRATASETPPTGNESGASETTATTDTDTAGSRGRSRPAG